MNYYIYISKSEIIIMIYINDLFIFEKEIKIINEIKEKLIEIFEMKNIRKLKYFLEMQIHRNRKKKILIII